jgi:hypothetical protein
MRPGIAAAVLVGLAAAARGQAAVQPPGDSQVTRANSPAPDGVRLPPSAAFIYRYVKLQMPGELNWQAIPWMVDLPEAIRAARAERRPLLLFGSGDDPLERC